MAGGHVIMAFYLSTNQFVFINTCYASSPVLDIVTVKRSNWLNHVGQTLKCHGNSEIIEISVRLKLAQRDQYSVNKKKMWKLPFLDR